MNKHSGFTIIELVVVIAIIGVLSSIVIVKTSSIKNKARDAAIKEDMNSFSRLALDYFEDHGNYGGFCESLDAETLFDAIPAYDEKKEKICQHDSDDWLVCAQLNFPEDRSKAWCIDKSGIRKQIDSADCQQGMTTCP
jgi:general secretion pathway protein G